MSSLFSPMSATADVVRADERSQRVIWAIAIGNGLITYDFTVYSFSAVIIGKLFFPSGNALLSLLLSLATFGAGFIMRPLGALLIGNLADRKGRRTGLTLSITLMTLGTGIIAFAPSYASIGWLAALLMVLARLMQGFAAGGEIGVSTTALMELADQGRRCYLTSWRGTGQGVAALAGALIGACTTAVLTPESMQLWGWRIPFALGMLIGPVGWYLRRQMAEQPGAVSHRPALNKMFALHPRALWFGILSMAGPSASAYIMVFYMPTYLVTVLHLPPVFSLLCSCFASVVIFTSTPLVALIADRQHGRKPIQSLLLAACILLIYPAFLALTHGVGQITSLLIILGYVALALSNTGPSAVMMLEAFPRHYRATGISIIYGVGVAIFGGFSPFIVTWLIGVTGNPMAPAWYLLATLCISLLALLRFPDSVHAD